MSLKAKLEAVIYAAEEPVTLAQLAANFAADALEWKAEQEAASAAQAAESAAQLQQHRASRNVLGIRWHRGENSYARERFNGQFTNTNSLVLNIIRQALASP